MATLPLFSKMQQDELERIAGGGALRRVERGKILFRAGEPCNEFHVVVLGQVKLFAISPTGVEKVIELCGPSDSFAEAVMFMEAPGYPVSAVAAVQSTVARFPSREYMSILRESPETCLRMLGNLSQRLHMRIREIEYLTLESATHRLVRLIESRLPADAHGPAEVTLQESRQELASRLSMKPETLSRLLRHLADAGAIVVHGRVLQVPDRKRLLAMLDSMR